MNTPRVPTKGESEGYTTSNQKEGGARSRTPGASGRGRGRRSNANAASRTLAQMEDAAKEASQLNFGPFEMQLREAEETRNIIEIEIKEINGRNTASPPLDNDVANIFFDKLGIRPWDASRIAMKTVDTN